MAQLYWGRMTALLTRLAYQLTPALCWIFVFVDDFMVLLRKVTGLRDSCILALFLTLVGCPISWRKNVLGKENRWLGYMVDISNLTVWLPGPGGEASYQKRNHCSLGRLQWVAKAYRQICPHLQPLYAREQKIQRKCKPGALVMFLAKLVRKIVTSGPCAPVRNCSRQG